MAFPRSVVILGISTSILVSGKGSSSWSEAVAAAAIAASVSDPISSDFPFSSSI
jgi:hypothetical protein